MEPTPAPQASVPPPSAPRFPWPIVVFLLLAIAGGAGAVAIQWSVHQKQIAASQFGADASGNTGRSGVLPSLANGAVEPGKLDLSAYGVLVAGEGDQVVIYGVLGPCEGHMQLRELLTEFAEEHSQQTKVVLFSGLGSPDGQRAIGSSCAGYVVTLRDEEGVLRPTASFEKAPGMGWTIEQIMAAADKAVAEASGAGAATPESAPTDESEPPETESATEETPEPQASST